MDPGMALQYYLGPRFVDDDKIVAKGPKTEVTSGGVRKPQDQHMALYLDETKAADAWLSEAKAFVDNHPEARFKWIVRPEIEWFQMTATDKMMTHRLSSKRCAVVATLQEV